jgi:hypothetical protein
MTDDLASRIRAEWSDLLRHLIADYRADTGDYTTSGGDLVDGLLQHLHAGGLIGRTPEGCYVLPPLETLDIGLALGGLDPERN